MTSLRRLEVRHTYAFNDTNIAPLTQLETLYIIYCDDIFTDRCIESLRNLTSITIVGIDTRITDKGLSTLTKLTEAHISDRSLTLACLMGSAKILRRITFIPLYNDVYPLSYDGLIETLAAEFPLLVRINVHCRVKDPRGLRGMWDFDSVQDRVLERRRLLSGQ